MSPKLSRVKRSTRLRHDFEGAVAHRPFRLGHLADVGALRAVAPLRQIASVEEHDGIRRRRAGGRARRHDPRMRPRRIVHVPRQARQRRRVGESQVRIGLLRLGWSLLRRHRWRLLRRLNADGREHEHGAQSPNAKCDGLIGTPTCCGLRQGIAFQPRSTRRISGGSVTLPAHAHLRRHRVVRRDPAAGHAARRRVLRRRSRRRRHDVGGHIDATSAAPASSASASWRRF